jgi:hypothetical protein
MTLSVTAIAVPHRDFIHGLRNSTLSEISIPDQRLSV